MSTKVHARVSRGRQVGSLEASVRLMKGKRESTRSRKKATGSYMSEASDIMGICVGE